MQRIGILKEGLDEQRVSLFPDEIEKLQKKRCVVQVEKGAGCSAFISNEHYENKVAKVVTRKEVLDSELVLSIHPLTISDLSCMKGGSILIGMFSPLSNTEFVKEACQRNITVFSLDMIPRSTRAQSMDVLSSQANIAGYKSIVMAAYLYGKYIPMFVTAAGSVPPAKVLILGAGVAGLQAIATARRLGAVVEVFDTRPVVKEEVMSLGAKFIEVPGVADASKAGGYAVEQSDAFKIKQQELISLSVAKADIIVTTAQIPGKKAPILITEQAIASMKPGSVIIDLAAGTGGNTPYTKDRETVTHQGIQIVGHSQLASTVPYDASKLFSKNIFNFLQLFLSNPDGQININFSDDIVQGCCLCHNGVMVHSRLKELL
ncbi:MAG: Re/Si-specific NAD(P)(+) transhydrogenase subunit alpha [Phycisphaerales bacterium]|nr:Re/Si-specific NAD(P)(+) transhydrogenase subunit alpha [Phycisphaerales bacterium]